MRSLFRITVVDPRSDTIYQPQMVIATSREEAMLKIKNLPEQVRDDPEKFDFCVEVVGEVRARKPVQKVEVVQP